jgi:hypothetical protein
MGIGRGLGDSGVSSVPYSLEVGWLSPEGRRETGNEAFPGIHGMFPMGNNVLHGMCMI